MLGAEQPKQLDSLFFSEIDGFLWLTPFEPVAKLGDHFNVTVGACARKSDMGHGSNAYEKGGALIMCDETLKHTWPRFKLSPPGPKVLFSCGPTRATTTFFYSEAERHFDFALTPKRSIDCRELATRLNDWFAHHDAELLVRDHGRWSMKQAQLLACPIDAELHTALKRRS